MCHVKCVTAVQVMCSIAAGCALIASTHLAAHPRESQVMWTTDIEPIVRTRCVGCHVEGGFAPMSLASYDEARKWGRAIANEVLEGRMPPWSPAPGFAQYANDRSLSQTEIEMLVSWGTGGTPHGPEVPHSGAHQDTATPHAADLVLTTPARAISGAAQRIELSTGVQDVKWISGWRFTPGNASAMAQAVISLEPGGVLGTWAPPDEETMYPEGVGMRLEAGARVVLDLHYRRSTRTQMDSSRVAFFFARGAARERHMESFACGTATLPRDVDVLSVTPRASAARASVEIVATRPDGTVEPLTVIPSFHPQYQRMYRLFSPVRLPKNTQLHVRSSAETCSADVELLPATRVR
jgi:hypothetical protein